MLGELHHPLATPTGTVRRGASSGAAGPNTTSPWSVTRSRAPLRGSSPALARSASVPRAEADEADGLPLPGGRARRVERAEQRDGHPAARHARERRRQDDVARRRGRVRRGAPGRAGADVEPLAARHALRADHDADDRAVAVPDRRGDELAVRALVLDHQAGGRLERGPVRTRHHGHVGHPGAGLRGQHVGAVGLEGVDVDRAVGADDGRHAPQRGLGDPQRCLERRRRGSSASFRWVCATSSSRSRTNSHESRVPISRSRRITKTSARRAGRGKREGAAGATGSATAPACHPALRLRVRERASNGVSQRFRRRVEVQREPAGEHPGGPEGSLR